MYNTNKDKDKNKNSKVSQQSDGRYWQKKKSNHLQNINNLARKYKNSSQLMIDQDQVRKARSRIDLEQQALDMFRDRQQKSDYYVDYNINPFMPIGNDKKKEYLQKLKAEGLKQKDLVQEKNKQNIDSTFKLRPQINKKISEIASTKVDFQFKSENVLASLKNKKQNTLFNLNNIYKNEKSLAKQTKRIMQSIQDQQETMQDFEIQQIAAFREQNFFLKKGKKINIFKFVRDNMPQICSIDYLLKHKFSFLSIAQRNQLFKIPIYRDLSYLGRATVNGSYKGSEQIVDYLNSIQMILNFKYLTFADILNAASNRFSPSYLQRVFYYEQKINQEEQSQQQEKQIIYRPQFKHKLNNYIGSHDQQIKQYRLLEYDPEEQAQFKNLTIKMQQVDKLALQQKYYCQNKVNDDKLHFHLTQNIKQAIRKIIYPDTIQTENNDIEKTVRLKKISVDRKQIIRFKAFGQMLKKKSYFSNIQQQLSDRKTNGSNKK